MQRWGRNSPFIEAVIFFSLSLAFSELYDSTRKERKNVRERDREEEASEQTTNMQIRSILFACSLRLFLLRSTAIPLVVGHTHAIIFFPFTCEFMSREKRGGERPILFSFSFYCLLPCQSFITVDHMHTTKYYTILKTATKRNTSANL